MTHYKNFIFYIIVTGIFLLLKSVYQYLNTEELLFLINPANFIVETISGEQSFYIANKGFYFPLLNIIIEKSCSGFDLWLISFLMLSFMTIKHFDTSFQKILSISISFLVAYFFTIIANSSRIFISIIIKKQPFLDPTHHYYRLHDGIGIANNITFLILLFLLIDYLLSKFKQHA